MFVGSADKVYIIDKVEGNAHQINGHSAYASVWWDIFLFLMHTGLTCGTGILTSGLQQPLMSRLTLSALRACISLMRRSPFLAGTALSVPAVTTLLLARPHRTIQPTRISTEGVLFGSLHLAMETSAHLRVLGLTLRIVS